MRILFAALAVTLAARALPAQVPQSDSARLIVTQDGLPIGTEDFALRVSQTRDGETQVSFVATTSGAAPMRVAVTAGGRRLTVRVAAGDREAAREYPGGPAALVADERVLSLYALVAGHAPGSVTVYGPPPNGRRPGTLEAGSSPLPSGAGEARHVVLRSGEDVVNVWYDRAGRLLRVNIPSRRLSAERVVSP
jgi:hypothetical protein